MLFTICENEIETQISIMKDDETFEFLQTPSLKFSKEASKVMIMIIMRDKFTYVYMDHK